MQPKLGKGGKIVMSDPAAIAGDLINQKIGKKMITKGFPHPGQRFTAMPLACCLS
jgi:hypothetical protein